MRLPLALLVISSLSLAAPPKGAATGSRLEQGQRAFADGDFASALKALDGALAEANDDATREKVHLLRGQVFAAQQDFARAETAFALALEANPEAALDPGRVDPSVVRVLDSLRNRLTGTLHVTAFNAEIAIDGKALGPTPLTHKVLIGRHRVEAKFLSGALASANVVLKPNREVTVALVESVNAACPKVEPCPAAPAAPADAPERFISPYADVRAVMENAFIDGGAELGLGAEIKYARLALHARVFPEFNLTPRFALQVPLTDWLQPFAELEVPLAFRSAGVAIGLGGAAGLEVKPHRVIGLFAQAGGKHFFTSPGANIRDRFTATLGVRLRLP